MRMGMKVNKSSIVFLGLAFLAPLVSLAETKAMTYRFGELDTHEFVRVPEEYVVISKKCIGSSGGKRVIQCEASSALKKVETLKLEGGLGFGVETASLICRKVGGMVLTGIDHARNEASFCEFSDGSRIRNGGLLLRYKGD